MLEMWMALPWWLRIGAGVLLIMVGALILFLGVTGRLIEGRRVIWWGSFALIGAGFVMVMIGGKSDSEKNGYHFWSGVSTPGFSSGTPLGLSRAAL